MSPFASLDWSYHVPRIAINGFSRIGRCPSHSVMNDQPLIYGDRHRLWISL
jgi:hypothetical protein